MFQSMSIKNAHRACIIQQSSSIRCVSVCVRVCVFVCVIRGREGGKYTKLLLYAFRQTKQTDRQTDRHVGGGQRDVDYLDGQLNSHIVIKYLFTHGDFQ